MNLQAVYNAPGTWVVMRGIPTEYKLTSGQYGPYALGKICDDAGQMADMMFSAGKNAPLPQQSLLNVPCIWAVKYDANTQKLKALFNSYAQQGSQAKQTPYTPHQTPQNAPQWPNTPPPGRDATGTSIERQVCVKAVAEIVVARPNMSMAEAGKWLEFFAQFTETGSCETPMAMGPANWDPNQDEQGPPVDDSDVPF